MLLETMALLLLQSPVKNHLLSLLVAIPLKAVHSASSGDTWAWRLFLEDQSSTVLFQQTLPLLASGPICSVLKNILCSPLSAPPPPFPPTARLYSCKSTSIFLLVLSRRAENTESGSALHVSHFCRCTSATEQIGWVNRLVVALKKEDLPFWSYPTVSCLRVDQEQCRPEDTLLFAAVSKQWEQPFSSSHLWPVHALHWADPRFNQVRPWRAQHLPPPECSNKGHSHCHWLW